MNQQFVYDVFLSHSSMDKTIVRQLAERLRKDGLKIWFDEWEIRPGDSILAKIEEGLESSRILVFCMSANAFGSDWASLEEGTFRFRDPLNKERRFIPIKLDDTAIRGSLAQFQYIDFRSSNSDQEYKILFDECFVAKELSSEKETDTRAQLDVEAQNSNVHSASWNPDCEHFEDWKLDLSNRLKTLGLSLPEPLDLSCYYFYNTCPLTGSNKLEPRQNPLSSEYKVDRVSSVKYFKYVPLVVVPRRKKNSSIDVEILFKKSPYWDYVIPSSTQSAATTTTLEESLVLAAGQKHPRGLDFLTFHDGLTHAGGVLTFKKTADPLKENEVSAYLFPLFVGMPQRPNSIKLPNEFQFFTKREIEGIAQSHQESPNLDIYKALMNIFEPWTISGFSRWNQSELQSSFSPDLLERLASLGLQENILQSVIKILSHPKFPQKMAINGELRENPIWNRRLTKKDRSLFEKYSPKGDSLPPVMYLDIFLIKAPYDTKHGLFLTYLSNKPKSGWNAHLFLHRVRQVRESRKERINNNIDDLADFIGASPDSLSVAPLGEHCAVSLKEDPSSGELVLYLYSFCSVCLREPPGWLLPLTPEFQLEFKGSRFKWYSFEDLEHDPEVMKVNADLLRAIHLIFGTTARKLIPYSIGRSEGA